MATAADVNNWIQANGQRTWVPANGDGGLSNYWDVSPPTWAQIQQGMGLNTQQLVQALGPGQAMQLGATVADIYPMVSKILSDPSYQNSEWVRGMLSNPPADLGSMAAAYGTAEQALQSYAASNGGALPSGAGVGGGATPLDNAIYGQQTANGQLGANGSNAFSALGQTLSEIKTPLMIAGLMAGGAGLANSLGGGTTATLADAATSLPSNYWNMVAGDVPAGGISSLSGADSLLQGANMIDPVTGLNAAQAINPAFTSAVTPAAAGSSLTSTLSNLLTPSPTSLATSAASKLLNANGTDPVQNALNTSPVPNTSANLSTLTDTTGTNATNQLIGGGTPTLDAMGNPVADSTYNLGNSGTGTVPLDTTSGLPTTYNGGAFTPPSNLDAAGQSALSRLLNGTATAADYAKLLQSGVDIAGALATTNRQNQLWDAGSAYRDRANAAMQPGFDLNSMPGYSGALQTSSDAFTRSLSAKGGNPAGTGAAQAETQKYLMGSVGLPAWQQYFNDNATVGYNPASVGAANSYQNLASAVGQGTNALTTNTGNQDAATAIQTLKNLGLLGANGIANGTSNLSQAGNILGNPATG